jgi:hypothetical protein
MLTKKEPSKNDNKNKTNRPEMTQSQPSVSSDRNSPTGNNTMVVAQNYSPTTKFQQKTRITIKYDVGFNNHFTIRGKGANLNWEKGQSLKNIKADEWIWETDAHFSQCEFKILINDSQYEKGENHLINCGASVVYTPKFN